jgi:hypothetical protein
MGLFKVNNNQPIDHDQNQVMRYIIYHGGIFHLEILALCTHIQFCRMTTQGNSFVNFFVTTPKKFNLGVAKCITWPKNSNKGSQLRTRLTWILN